MKYGMLGQHNGSMVDAFPSQDGFKSDLTGIGLLSMEGRRSTAHSQKKCRSDEL